MSAQGGTLQRRGTIELPIWPVAVLVVVAVAAAIGMTLLRDTAPTGLVRPLTDSERFSNITTGVREQGAVAPTIEPIDLRNSGTAIRERGFAVPTIAIDPVGLERSSAAFREQGATLGLNAVWGVSHVTPSAIWGVSHVTPSAGAPREIESTPETEFTPTVTWHRPEV